VQTTKLIFLAVSILLSGCAAPLILTGLGVGSVAVHETTGKTLTDHTVSTVAQQDCRVGRIFQDQNVCQNKTQTVTLQITTTGIVPSTVEEIQAKYR
jgi:hypothetical protein